MNLFVESDLTHEGVRRLLASKDDSEMRQLRISTDGRIYISDDVGATNLAGVLVYFETWSAEGYCGEDASKDASYVDEILGDLQWIRRKNYKGYFDGRY
ncbi:hypothetical protein [Mesorhizobium neociceri]|uniref:Uncharacterized protein n=1 Tax=Mesorhizobium neociceri TaxID=1307853 RepID=A0A838B7V4_9HYPH|nr:hypothetical protein [Mesorhizobium neociceri]MBA1142818.1 hypothetical protein [Mesorhizobium neociceri]